METSDLSKKLDTISLKNKVAFRLKFIERVPMTVELVRATLEVILRLFENTMVEAFKTTKGKVM